MTERTERIDIIDVKERIAVGEQLTPLQRDFVLDCINEATKFRRDAVWSCGHVAGAMCAECYRELAQRANALVNELQNCRDIRSEAIARLMKAGAFLDELAVEIDAWGGSPKRRYLFEIAADCRAMAAKLRGET